MRTTLFVVLSMGLAVTGCKKDSTVPPPPGGGGGGGGGSGSGGGSGGDGWLVGNEGLMANVAGDRVVGNYDIGSTENLNAIACRYQGEAWAIGDHATLLYTNDGGEYWESQVVPTTANLRTVATQDDGPVFIGGDGAFLVTTDTGAHWTNLGDGVTNFRSMSAPFATSGVLALDDSGGLWQYDNGALHLRTTLAGARAIHTTTAGDIIMTAGRGIMKSTNGGATFQPLTVDPDIVFDDIRVADDGSAVAVGANGAIANIDVNGGVTVQYLGTSTLHTIHIHHDTTGYAAGDDGTVIITHDAGLTWQPGPNVGRTVRGLDEIGFGHR